MKTNKNWLLTTYGKFDRVIEAVLILDRTEHEAERESFNYANAQEVKDWTLVDLDKEVKRFMKEFGMKQKEVKETNGFNGGTCAVSEMAINFGYVWIEKFQKWVDKNNSSFDERDKEVFEYIRKTYCD